MVPISFSEYVLKNSIRQVVQESSICVLVSVEMNDPVSTPPQITGIILGGYRCWGGAICDPGGPEMVQNAPK
jgi:hypothetical protein